MSTYTTYLDFVIEVSQIAEETYTSAVRSAAGEARTITKFPFSLSELDAYLLRLENAILRSAGGFRSHLLTPLLEVQQFGAALFDFLFVGETRSLYYECLRVATHQNHGVRLKLNLQAPMLAALPWEFLYDPRKHDFICLDPHTPLMRYMDLPQTPPPLSVKPPLQILGLIADPVDLDRLNVEEERHRVNEAVASLVDRGLVEVTWLKGQTWRDLQRVMRSHDDPWHILHFVGHGGFDKQHNEGFIVLANDQGRAHQLSATQLARLLARQRTALRLVMLNACQGGRSGPFNLLSSTAATLIANGTPGVLAMQYEISDMAAIEFARTFYEALADNLPIDTAVAEARNAINFWNARSLEWVVPVLYMRAHDGALFALQAQSRHTSEQKGNDASAPGGNKLANTAGALVSPSNPVLPASPLLPPVAPPVVEKLESQMGVPAQNLPGLSVANSQTGAKHPAVPVVDLATAALPAKPLSDTPEDNPSPPLEEAVALDLTDFLRLYAYRHHAIIGFDWVMIPAGEFIMGSDRQKDAHAFEDECPQHSLFVPAFRIARTLVTNAQYKLFVATTNHRAPVHWVEGEIPAGKELHPVVNVSWQDANAFCEWAGVRLPTEAEWEKAARGEEGRLYPWGDEAPTEQLCNFDMYVGGTTPVGNYPAGASPYGVLDLAGNVWEWTATKWLDSYENYARRVDSRANETSQRVLRGGGFGDVEFVRCAARSWDVQHQRYRDLGFRVVALE